jgi:hypothetical protein
MENQFFSQQSSILLGKTICFQFRFEITHRFLAIEHLAVQVKRAVKPATARFRLNQTFIAVVPKIINTSRLSRK